MDIALRSCTLGFVRPNWHCAVLLPAFAKVVTMCPGVMWSGALDGAGKTLNVFTVRWRTPGLYLRTQILHRDSWSEDHEGERVK
jgi:hypothetical protein